MNKSDLVEAYIRARLDAMAANTVAMKLLPVEETKTKPPAVAVLMPPVKNDKYDVDRVLAAVAIAHGVTPAEIRGKRRSHNIVWARHHATWLLRQKTDLSLVTLAVITNRICHSSVHNSLTIFEHNRHRFAKQLARAEEELAK